MRILPEMWARMTLPPGISHRNIAFGSASRMLPSTSILSSLPINRQYLRALLRDEHRVLEMSRKRAVLGHGRPAVGQRLHLGPAGVDHGLDGEHQARLQPHARAAAAVVRDGRVLVKGPADAVTHEIAHDGEAVG